MTKLVFNINRDSRADDIFLEKFTRNLIVIYFVLSSSSSSIGEWANVRKR